MRGESLSYSISSMQTGETLTVYLTGLGSPIQMPEVLIEGERARIVEVTKLADRPGINRVDFIVPALPSPTEAPLVVVSVGKRRSNPARLRSLQ